VYTGKDSSFISCILASNWFFLFLFRLQSLRKRRMESLVKLRVALRPSVREIG
jgi:hypothetical protein